MKGVTSPSVPTIAFGSLSDAAIKEALKKYQIGLTVKEAKKIEQMLGRAPTVVEAVIWGIQGSEHCSYKSSRRFLKMFPTTGKHVILGPKEDSGIVAITDGPKGKRWGLVISHESHNHPSQIVPFEGAATGVGGTVRDVVCMGARVIGCLDLLRLGDLQSEESRTIAKEVTRGIAGYGNPLGLPNLGGDTVFDASYNSNCLVNAIAVGIVREDEVIHSYVPEEAARIGYDIILIGKPTDRSGFGGAAFASLTMEEDKREKNAGAVQEPNPFLERHLLASTYALFDWLAAEKKLDKVSFKDLGAGGVVCSSVEQIAERGFGAEVDLDCVHTAIPGLPPEVIACAETQERFCWICHPDLTDHILKHYNEIWDLPSVAENARASIIGKVNVSGMYRLKHKGSVVCEAKSQDITSGLQYVRPTKLEIKKYPEPAIDVEGSTITLTSPIRFQTSIQDVFERMIASPNGCSREPIIKHYDKDVIGISHTEAGEADAGVILPLQDLGSYVHDGSHPGWNDLPETDRWTGVALAGDGNGRYGRISPYAQGANAAVEAMMNVAAVGAVPRAISDCLNYGNPEIPQHLAALEEGVRGIADACRGIIIDAEPVPVISGNVSLYNATTQCPIDPTAIVCAIGILKDGRKAVPMQLQSADSVMLMLGDRKDECGGSLYYEILEQMSAAPRDALLGSNVPKPNFSEVAAQISFVTKAAEQGLLRSCHDISDGGLLLAAFEMTLPQRKIGGSIGMMLNTTSIGNIRSDAWLFSQTPGFLIEANRDALKTLKTSAEEFGIPLREIGSTHKEPILKVAGSTNPLLQIHLSEAQKVHKNGLNKLIS